MSAVAEPERPRAAGGRAPDVFRVGGWVSMREFANDEAVDFVIVGTGAGGGTLACRLVEKGFSVVAFDAGPFFRPLEDFASDEAAQAKLYWTDERISDGVNPLRMGRNNLGKAVGGSTVHFAMVSLRFRPERFRSRTLLGYGGDWPVDWHKMWAYYDRVEHALAISGPVNYPWGPKRHKYPYRSHPLNASAEVLARGCEATGIGWAPMPLATVSAPRGKAPPRVQRGFCRFGCSTNAKQSALTVWIPRALNAGAEIRDLAMVGRIEVSPSGKATGVHYHREQSWHFQRVRHVVVAGYAIGTPRLLLNSACPQFQDGLANSSGLVGKYLMTQSNQGVWGRMDDDVRWNKGPPNLAVSEHWNYEDAKDFFGGYVFMSQGPMPIEWVNVQAGAKKLGRRASCGDARLQPPSRPQGCGRSAAEPRQRCSPLGRDRPIRPSGPAYHLLLDRQRQGADRAFDATDGDVPGRRGRDRHLPARRGYQPPVRHRAHGRRCRAQRLDPNGRSWDIPNLWVCDGSVFPTSGAVNPSLTIQALAMRTADRIETMAARGEL